MLGFCSTVSGNVDIEPLFRGDKPEIFALRLSTLPNTTGYTPFDLVRGPYACGQNPSTVN